MVLLSFCFSGLSRKMYVIIWLDLAFFIKVGNWVCFNVIFFFIKICLVCKSIINVSNWRFSVLSVMSY